MAESFLQRIARGDESAVAACLDEFGGTIWSLADRYLRGYGDDLEDAVQEVFVEVWRSAPRYDPTRGSEASFIATIAHRRLIDRQRRNQARRSVQIQDERMIESKPVVRERADLHDDARRAAEAFETLGQDEKQVLWYALYQGFSHERIATAIDVPLGTVKTRIRRGLSRLREMLAGPAPEHAVVPTGKGVSQ